ncbi:uncharacterized protein SCHCODRAFT_02103135 [Schizophyllum commune H4-8]|uniref:uncharacterized protein n=1 Tax=Schizophyllum commune (strain H4-8 / FGSC 9210) TaxID=578458 RepID=UPI00215FA1A5|nr:uncharacterized protein SCHCODRAFT_02103135 [Schizophyllum commune H4-8]KAI5886640.1 hypothetical protein SCHCODRAFT_02103135 [Schizophyllum commune H4-8]
MTLSNPTIPHDTVVLVLLFKYHLVILSFGVSSWFLYDLLMICISSLYLCIYTMYHAFHATCIIYLSNYNPPCITASTIANKK